MEEVGPKDPIGELTANAIALHESFQALIDAGFEREEAFELFKYFMFMAQAS